MIKKYLKIYKIFFDNAVSYEAQYRGDTIMKLVTNILWVGMLFIVIEVIFSQTPSLAGWSKGDVYLMTILWIMADELFVALFAVGMEAIPDHITDGTLDTYLTKPISALFTISTKTVAMRALYRFFVQIPILVWLLLRFDFSITFSSAILAVLLVIVAILIEYSRVLIANTLSFWFYRIDNVNELMASVTQLGKYPIDIWPKTLKIIFLTAVPVVFSGFMPAATLVGRWPWYGVLYAFIFSALLFLLAVKFWNFALKRYSSASS